jgi:hypothetical protein
MDECCSNSNNNSKISVVWRSVVQQQFCAVMCSGNHEWCLQQQHGKLDIVLHHDRLSARYYLVH